jgi:hypothetical protein
MNVIAAADPALISPPGVTPHVSSNASASSNDPRPGWNIAATVLQAL